MSSRIPSPECQRVTPVTSAGLVRVHGPVSNRCPGSLNPPMATSTAAPATICAITSDSLQEQVSATLQLTDLSIQSTEVSGPRPSIIQDQGSPDNPPSSPPPPQGLIPSHSCILVLV